MDHVVSSLILSPSFFLCPLDPLRPENPGLSGNLPCDIWLPALRQKVKGGPGAHFTEMQKSSDFFGDPLDDVRGFGCAHHAAARQQLAQVETFARTFPRRSKQQSTKFPMSKKIFPWMKESRHSEQKHDRTIAGLYDTDDKRGPFSFKLPLTSSYAVNEGN